VDRRRFEYLDAMGVPVWVPRSSPGASVPASQGSEQCLVPAASEDGRTAGGGLGWAELQGRVVGCMGCELHRSRTQTVFGTGSRDADWMVIGEAPGADEDRQGEPFVGRAGQLLNAMLRGIGLSREDVYIANILKCRPPRNRDPRPEEVAACEAYLHRQVELVRPRVILAVGRIAAHNLLKTDTALGRMRGRRYTYSDTEIPVVVTYHPAYLLRNPADKRKAWQDLKFAQRMLVPG